MPNSTQIPVTQRQLDEMAFEMYVDCGRSMRETVRQTGVPASTLRGRIRRHGRRLQRDSEYQRQVAEAIARGR